MTQMVLNISDSSIVPGLCKVLRRIGGVEKVNVIKETRRKPSDRQAFLDDFRHAVGQLKEYKEGKTDSCTWEEMMNEL